MSYNSDAHITLGQLKTSLSRVKTEYEAAISDADSTIISDNTATDEEVTEMLDEIFASSETTEE